MCSSNGFLRSLFSPLSGRDVKGALQVSEKRSTAVILSPFAVILSASKNLALPLRVNYPKDLALFIFNAMRDSSFAMLRTACGSSE